MPLLISPGDEVTLRSLSRIVDRLSEATDSRIMPMIGEGSWQSLVDVGLLPYVNLAVVGRSVLQFADGLGGDAVGDIVPIASLGYVVAHVVARKDIATLDQLRGKRVSFGDGRDNFYAAGVLFDRLQVTVEAVDLPTNASLEALRNGEIDAAVFFGCTVGQAPRLAVRR